MYICIFAGENVASNFKIDLNSLRGFSFYISCCQDCYLESATFILWKYILKLEEEYLFSLLPGQSLSSTEFVTRPSLSSVSYVSFVCFFFFSLLVVLYFFFSLFFCLLKLFLYKDVEEWFSILSRHQNLLGNKKNTID